MVFREHAEAVSCLAWSPDDSILLTAADTIIKMWNAEVRFPPSPLSFLPLTRLPIDRDLYRYSRSTRVPHWRSRMDARRSRFRLRRHGQPNLLLGPSLPLLFLSSTSLMILSFVQDLAGNVTARLDRCPSRIIDLAVSPSGSKLICVGRANTTEPHLVPSNSRGGSAYGSRAGTPANASATVAAAAALNGGGLQLGARHEKRVSVFEVKRGRESESELL